MLEFLSSPLTKQYLFWFNRIMNANINPIKLCFLTRYQGADKCWSTGWQVLIKRLIGTHQAQKCYKVCLPFKSWDYEGAQGWLVGCPTTGCCSELDWLRLMVLTWIGKGTHRSQGTMFSISKGFTETTPLPRKRTHKLPKTSSFLAFLGIASLYGFMPMPSSDWLWMT